ncbi:MAG: cation diffusion facilitator family transporter [Bacilli bacterium]|nr:cation diffusion facilitator family transporter [Bacilli bacterium]
MKEKKLIILTAILNFISASLKFVFGIVFSFSTLIADSVQSFLDFITDIISLVVNRIGKRRANKTYPFGYGQVYYLSNIFTGLLLLLIGLFIVYQIFTFNNKFIPNVIILIGLLIVLIIKGVVIALIKGYTNSTKSELLVESYKESAADFISTCVVILVLIITFFEEYIPNYINVDKIGSICMAIYIFYTSIKIIISNVRGILTNDEGNDELKNSIKKELEKFKEFQVVKIKIIKMSYYYSVFLQIDVNDDIKIRKFLKMKKKIKNNLKSLNKLIKYIDIEPL